MDVFSQAIPANENLDPAFIEAHGYRSLVIPELPSNDEIFAVARMLGETQFQALAHEWQKAPLIAESDAIGDIVAFLNEELALNQLLRFVARDVFFWIPGEHEYFVLFGNGGALASIEANGIFPLSLDDYLDGGGMSSATAEFLRATAAEYGR